MSLRSPLRPLALAAALLALAPAAASGVTGGASADGAAAAPSAATGGASVGTAPPHASAQRRVSAGGADARRRPRHRRRRRHRASQVDPAPVTPAASPAPAFATLLPDGTAAPPPGAPPQVVAAIAAGNRIASLPYRWGGGHATWEDVGYDCSGSVGYALHGGGLLDASATSGELMAYGEPGPGTWITLYANADHVYMVVAGLRFDTSGADPSRWQTAPRSADGYAVRHPAGL